MLLNVLFLSLCLWDLTVIDPFLNLNVRSRLIPLYEQNPLEFRAVDLFRSNPETFIY